MLSNGGNVAHYLPWIVAGGAVAVTALVLAVDDNLLLASAFLGTMAFAMPAAFGVGYYLLMATPRYRAFVYTRPIRNEAIARAKLKAALHAVVLVFLLNVLSVGILVGAAGGHLQRDILAFLFWPSLGTWLFITMGPMLLVLGIAAYAVVLAVMPAF